MSYVDDLVARKPEIRSFSQYITNNLADNYVKGLNGKYASRLSKGVEVATQTAAESLPAIIQGLISDRMVQRADTRVTSNDVARLAEGQQRALVLALWSVRIPKINRDGKIDIENRKVYRDENYIPQVDNAHITQNEGHEPTLQELENLLRRLSRKGSSNE